MPFPVPSVVVVVALWLAGLCAAAQFAKVGLVLPELAHRYPDAGASLGLLVSLISVVGIVFGLAAGALASIIGLRRVLLGSLALGALISLMQALMPPLPSLLALRVLEGIAHLGIVVTAPTLIASLATDRWRPAAMTLWGTFFGVSFALVGWLGLPLVERHGVEVLWLVHAGATVAVTVCLLLTLPRDTARVAGSTSDSPAVSLRSIVERHAAAWRSPHTSAPAFGWVFYTLTFVALLAVLPTLVPPVQRATLATALPLASIVSSMTLGVALLWICSAARVITIGFAASAVLVLLLPGASTDPVASLVLCVALFAALGLVQGASFAAVPQLNAGGHERALANGALAQAGNLGNSIGTPLLMGVLAAGGVGGLAAASAACYVAGLAAHVALDRARRRLLAS